MLDDFAVFILSHGRPDRIDTLKTLKKAGYTGRIYIIIDNEDKTAPKYHELYGDMVIVFDKAAIAQTFDEGDNFEDRRAVIYARNACFQIARDLGITYFLQLDDDYTKFDFLIDDEFKYPSGRFIIQKGIDNVFCSFLNYYRSINAKSIAMAQGGDFITRYKSDLTLKRKCMNTFFCSIDRSFQFIGRINEDVNTYTCYQNRGNLFLTVPIVKIDQRQTQRNPGGMSEMYLDSGTYVKSFYPVMYLPNSVSIGLMGRTERRLHHVIKWDNAVPCIISEQYRH